MGLSRLLKSRTQVLLVVVLSFFQIGIIVLQPAMYGLHAQRL